MEEVGHPKTWMIIGDSSGRAELLDMKKHGYSCRGIKKGPGTKLSGMKKLKIYNVKITRSSPKTIYDFSQWLYDEDHNGKIIPGPPKGHEPDVVASARYVAMGRPWWSYLIPKKTTKVA